MTEKKAKLLGPDHPDFTLDDYPLYNLNRTSATYIEKTTDDLKDYNMDQPSWRVLMLLGDKNPSTVGDLSRRSVTKFSTITRILMRMEKEGLMIRKPFPEDNRVIEVFITDKGKQSLVDLRKLAGNIYDQAFDGIAGEDILKFTDILMRIRQNLSSK
ncbi:MAG: MarR family transcriptional regulator [Emcibacteraceae bacterium]|nr:MarR family transcriptional regulator [Emcibacteraceae bacterium]MDG1858999.1 MarR family transcriptional regulator [Emcibacteraceae bacterium]